MNDDLFQELLDSVREGGKILRGEIEASRSFVVEEPDVSAIREAYELSQEKLASLLGRTIGNLQCLLPKHSSAGSHDHHHRQIRAGTDSQAAS